MSLPSIATTTASLSARAVPLARRRMRMLRFMGT